MAFRAPSAASGVEHGHSRRAGAGGALIGAISIEAELEGDRPGAAPAAEERGVEAQARETLRGAALKDFVLESLDDDKAIDPVVVDLAGKTDFADFMVVATGGSQRHVAAMAEKLIERLKARGMGGVAAEGAGTSDWVLLDLTDVVVHLFRAETRVVYDIERLWSVAPPAATSERAARRAANG